jgi:heavy metal efflux system protein
MKNLVHALLRYRPLVMVALAAWLAAGLYFFFRLDIEAYPDPSPPLVEMITQNPAWSAEEMEQQVTVPMETALFGVPNIQHVRSISIFGLSDVKLYFDYSSDYFRDRQEVLNRVQLATLPGNLQPQLSPWSPVGEIYRYRLEGPNYTLNDLSAEQNWYVVRALKQVPGIIDVTTFGGTSKQYQAEIDPQKLLQYNVTLPQVLAAISAGNANVGGNYLSMGNQNVDIRGLGLLHGVGEMQQVLVTERQGVPVFLSDVANVHEGFQPPLGRVGMDGHNNVVEGIVLLQRGEQSLPALKALRERVEELNQRLLPPGMKIHTIYDRTDLIKVTTETVRRVVIMGLVLVTTLLLIFLGDIPMSLITALTVPLALLFALSAMVMAGQSANLISLGAIDFGILVDSALIVLENIHRRLHGQRDEQDRFEVIAESTADSARPVLFSTLVILVAFIPLFTMRGVPGKIFAPMSITYGYALTGALIFALLFAPVLASWFGKPRANHGGRDETLVVRGLRVAYSTLLRGALKYRAFVLAAAGIMLAVGLVLYARVGGEFMPALEEGNLWVRATLPQDVSLEYATDIGDQIRDTLRGFPTVTHIVSQIGRPDDGTDVTTFNNVEFFVQLLPQSAWPRGLTKAALIHQMDTRLHAYRGIDFNFSQNIQDNVEEAMSGVKGENSLKLFGDDIDVLQAKAEEIRNVMAAVPGVKDLAVFQETGQPQMTIAIDREASARYGVMAADVNAAVQAAVGGQSVTQILEGDRRFDFVVRFLPQFRQDPESIRNILVPTPDGGHVPLGQVAQVDMRHGSFMIYRENGRRYIPIKFSVRGRDLAGTMKDVQTRIENSVKLPAGYNYEWAGEFDSLQKEQRRLLIVVPISLIVVMGLLYTSFNSLLDACIVMGALPFGAVGGILALYLTGTAFSISAAVGFASAFGVGTLAGLVFLGGIRRASAGAASPKEGMQAGAMAEMRPVMMACLAAGLGLLPAAMSTGIGAQAQQPLARVVVGAMVTTVFAILFLIPVLASYRTRSS